MSSSKAYYAAYNASEAGRARLRKYLQSPQRKIYRAAYDDAHDNREKKREYDRNYYHKVTQPKLDARPHIIRHCRTLFCTGTFMTAPTDGRRKYCGECQHLFGLTATARYHWRKKHKDNAAA